MVSNAKPTRSSRKRQHPSPVLRVESLDYSCGQGARSEEYSTELRFAACQRDIRRSGGLLQLGKCERILPLSTFVSSLGDDNDWRTGKTLGLPTDDHPLNILSFTCRSHSLSLWNRTESFAKGQVTPPCSCALDTDWPLGDSILLVNAKNNNNDKYHNFTEQSVCTETETEREKSYASSVMLVSVYFGRSRVVLKRSVLELTATA